MKRITGVVFALLILMCSSCATNQTLASSYSSDTTTQMETSAQVTEIIITGDPYLIDNINQLVEASDIIIIGTIEEALPVVRIEAVSLGLVFGFPEYYKNVSSYNVKVEQVYKGDVSIGGYLRLDRNGGEADGIFENQQGLNYPVEGSRYLMFINETDISDKTDYFKYVFEGTYDGFSEIIDGKLYPQENTSIFKTGMLIDDATSEIVVALKAVSD